MLTNISREYFNAITEVAKQVIPVEVMVRARQSLLDFLSVTCAGVQFQQEKMENYFCFALPESGAFKAIGTGKSLTLKEAVFLNGLNAHALDYDDGTNSGIIHLGAPIFSLLIPLAQRYCKTIDEMLRSAVIGYEASYTMAVSIQPKHKALGFHATGTCGMLGATLAGAFMLGFSEEERYRAFATSCISASGMLKVLDDGSELKPYNVAKTALLSLTSLQLAKAGFKGNEDPLGGYRGFFKMMTGDESVAIKPTMLNNTYAIMKSYTKPYASCRYTHPPIEATIHLRNQCCITPEKVSNIEVRTYNLAVSGHDHSNVKGSYSAKMSTPYSIAVALTYGKVGLKEFEKEVIENEEIKALSKKVHVISDESLSKVFPQKQSAIVSITTIDGVFSKRVDYPKGEPENPFKETEFWERYKELMSYGRIPSETYNSIYELTKKGYTKVAELVNKL